MDYLGDGVTLVFPKKTFLYAANNRNGFLCGRELVNKGCIPKALLLHPVSRRKWGDEICSLFPDIPVIEWNQDHFSKLNATGAEILLSVNFGYTFPPEILSFFAYPMNLHTGYLPFNRGTHPNVWSIAENTPAGVTLHLMTAELDKGDIIAQQEVAVLPTDTGLSLYEKLEEASAKLIGDTFPSLLAEEIHTTPMPEGGTFHCALDFEALCALSPEENLTVENFLRRLRALSFPPYKNAYFLAGEKKVYLDITMALDEE